MNKLISLVLSISLIFGSITPSFAQSNKIIPGAAKTLGKSGAEVAGKSAAGQLSVKGWKYIPGAKAPVATTKAPYNPAIGKLAVTGQPLSTSTHRAAQVSTGSSAAASKKALDQHIEARDCRERCRGSRSVVHQRGRDHRDQHDRRFLRWPCSPIIPEQETRDTGQASQWACPFFMFRSDLSCPLS